MRPHCLAESLEIYLAIARVLEQNKYYVNQNPKCEPQLGKRGLYRSMGGQTDQPLNEFAMLWVLNLTDGQHSLMEIAERAGLPFQVIYAAAEALLGRELLKPCTDTHLR